MEFAALGKIRITFKYVKGVTLTPLLPLQEYRGIWVDKPLLGTGGLLQYLQMKIMIFVHI